MMIRGLLQFRWLNWIAERRLPGRVDWHAEASAYVDGELSASDTARLESRLTRSPELRAYLADLRAFDTMMRQVAAPPSPPSEGPTPAMLELARRVPASDFQVREQTGWPAPLRVGAAAAVMAVMFLALVIFDVVDPGVRYAETSASSVSQETVSIPTREVTTQQRQVPAAAQVQQAAVDESASEQASVASFAEQQAAPAAQEQAVQAASDADAASPEAAPAEESAEPVVAQDGESSAALTSAYGSADDANGEGDDSAQPEAASLTAQDESEADASPTVASAQERQASDEVDTSASGDADASAVVSATAESDDADSDQPAQEAGESEAEQTTTVRDIEERDGEPTVVAAASEPGYPQLPRASAEAQWVEYGWMLWAQIALGTVAIVSALLWLYLEWRARRTV